MRLTYLALSAVAMASVVFAAMASEGGVTPEKRIAHLRVTIPEGYRQWELIRTSPGS